MKIALAQLNYHTGNFENNTNKIIDAINNAKNNGADLIVFAELAICGYPPRDFLEFSDFIDSCMESVNKIAKECIGIAAIVGSPSVNTDKKGKGLFNSAYFLSDGKIQSVHHKSLLPTYDIFDENRYFQPNNTFEVVEYQGKKIAITICEDIWNLDNQLYTTNPLDELINFNPDFAINISASPFSYFHDNERKNLLSRNAKKYNLPFFYVNHVGAQTELIFDGASLVADENGIIRDELLSFKEETKVYDLESLQENPEIKFTTHNQQGLDDIDYALIHDALILGIKDYFQKLGFAKAILGISGGIDSALTLVLSVSALGKENVVPILLPSKFSSDHSISDSIELCKNLGVKCDEINIEKVVESVENTLSPHFNNTEKDITEENIQARARAVLLMALSNKFGYILLNTSNKSEGAVGYGTLYGDMCGGLSVLGDVYKTQVYDLAKYINQDSEVIPQNIISKPPSAELKPDQKDSDSLPEYDILDKILFQYIENRKGPKEIISMGFEEKLVRKVLKLVNTNEYKRYQTPPILRISEKAFGMGRRVPIVAKYLS
ncbi:MAG: NAD+ synthase [Bacteroidia bacterium]|nr:NAD+ synthase [Bacteroidia bacterium]